MLDIITRVETSILKKKNKSHLLKYRFFVVSLVFCVVFSVTDFIVLLCYCFFLFVVARNKEYSFSMFSVVLRNREYEPLSLFSVFSPSYKLIINGLSSFWICLGLISIGKQWIFHYCL